jgi:flagellar basal-body rod modification protein FlgD
MNIPGISTNDTVPTSLGGNAFATQDLDRGAFLDLFVAQLKNQDPLDPVQNEQFVEQLATFSSLEQLEELNDNTVAMIALNQSNALLSQLTQSSGLIGKTISWVDPTTGAVSSGTVDRVKLMNGLAVLSVGDLDVPLATVIEIVGADAPTEAEEGDLLTESEDSEQSA